MGSLEQALIGAPLYAAGIGMGANVIGKGVEKMIEHKTKKQSSWKQVLAFIISGVALLA